MKKCCCDHYLGHWPIMCLERQWGPLAPLSPGLATLLLQYVKA